MLRKLRGSPELRRKARPQHPQAHTNRHRKLDCPSVATASGVPQRRGSHHLTIRMFLQVRVSEDATI